METNTQKVRLATSSTGKTCCEVKKRRILGAAAKLFAERDYHEVLIDHVAQSAQVGKGTVYRYFKDKEALFIEIMHVALNEAMEAMTAEVSQEASIRGKLRKAVTGALVFWVENAGFYNVLNHHKTFRFCREREDLKVRRDTLRRFIASLFEAGQRSGEIRTDLEAEFLSALVQGAIQNVRKRNLHTHEAAAVANRILDVMLNGAGTGRIEQNEKREQICVERGGEANQGEDPGAETTDLVRAVSVLQRGRRREEEPLVASRLRVHP